MKNVANVVWSVVHLVMGILLMLAAQFVGQKIAFSLFRGNPVLVYITYSVIYTGLAILLAVLYARFTERLTCRKMGLVNRPSPVWLAVGLALPLGVTAFYLLAVNGTYHQVSTDVAFVLASETLTALIAGPVEEVIFRGMLMQAVRKRLGTIVGVLLPSFLFAAVHIIMMQEVTALSYIQLLISGTAVAVMFSLIALYSGSVWASSIVHSLWNIIMIGGILSIHAPGTGVVSSTLYEYELSTGNMLLTGGNYGVESLLSRQ